MGRPPDERPAVHRRLKEAYEHGARGSVSGEWEALHHELLGADAELRSGDRRLRFIEQLQEIGRTLSRVYRDYPRAARLFRAAVEIDPRQAYSHHYLAFNLDFMAEEPAEVEWHYQEAIRLQPRHPWWWSRWISYLVTRGRFKQARTEWRRALEAMSVSEDGSPPWLYLSLHRWVARWLLHWSDLGFAEEVIRSIPPRVTTDASIQELRDRLDALKAAERGNAVFPLTVPPREWRSAAPHTDLPLEWMGRRLVTWMPARVGSVDKRAGVAYLRAAKLPPTREGLFRYLDLELTRADVEGQAHAFGWDDLAEGRFLEIGDYGDGVRCIGLHREAGAEDPLAVGLVPRGRCQYHRPSGPWARRTPWRSASCRPLTAGTSAW